MDRSYINQVKFRHEEIKLRKPREIRFKSLPRLVEGVHRNLLKILFTLFIIGATLFAMNFLIVTVVNACRETEYKTVIGCWKDFQEYQRNNSY